jgi:hypothetical protein
MGLGLVKQWSAGQLGVIYQRALPLKKKKSTREHRSSSEGAWNISSNYLPNN